MATDIERTLHDLIARVGRVRRWLLAISVLRSAALGLAFVSLYIGVYALLDHQIRFGRFGRIAAFVLFAALLAGGLYHVLRVLRREMTYANAANYIESRHSFDQQLVAAVEFYEGRSDYPYSEALARQLVQQVHQAAAGYRFDATVARWQGWLLASFVLLCLLVAGLFVRQNVLFVSAYLARLFRPFSEVQPVSATTLDATTGNVVTSPDAPVTLTAAIQGRMPESAVLVVTRREPNEANDVAPSVERIEASPARDAQGHPTFTVTTSFDRLGQYEYRFETPAADSAPHTIRVCEPPALKGITAQITPPAKAGTASVPPYEQQVTGGTLEVLPGSRVELTMQATKPLREASVSPAQGPPSVQQADGADSFRYGLTADKATSLKLDMTSMDGLGSAEPQELQIALKTDERPQFKLVCPEGDYLATDVASVPITFEVTDDFGLAAAQLHCELPGRGPAVLESAAPQGAKQLSLTHTLELEQYDLHVGDTILFYATATDIDTGQRTSDANASSEMYFIEIRPYQQYWHPEAGGKPSSQPGVIPEDLLTLLEYTRALLKKTWTLARAPQTAAQDRSRFEALGADVQYCSRLLTKTRDDPDAGFSEADKAVLNQILDSYEQAAGHLKRRDASAALPPEENAYRTLRKFIDELHLKWSPPETGASAPQQTPERVKLQEQPPAPEADKERLESQLKEMQKKIDALTRQQESLKSDLNKALQQEKKASPGAGQTSNQTSSPGSSEGQSSAGQSQGQQDRRQQTSQDTSRSRTQNGATKATDGKPGAKQSSATASNSPGQSGQSGQEQGSSGEGQTARQGNAPEAGDRGGQSERSGQKQGSSGKSRSAQQGNMSPAGGSAGTGGQSGQEQSRGEKGQGAQQGNASQTRGSAGKDGQSSSGQERGGSTSANGGDRAGSEGSLPGTQETAGRSSRSTGGRTRQASADLDARLRMLQARQQALREQVAQLDAELGQLSASERSEDSNAQAQAQEHLQKAIEAMKQFEAKLADSRYGSPTASEAIDLGAPADSAARRLADAGRTIQRRLSGDDEEAKARQAQELADQLAKDAEAYDESLSEAEKKQMLDRLEAAKKLLESMAGPQWGMIGRGGTPGTGHVLTNDSHTAPAEVARMLAREFWSVALEARQRRSQLLEDEPSDVEFFEAENEFFENAARFGRPRTDQ